MAAGSLATAWVAVMSCGRFSAFHVTCAAHVGSGSGQPAGGAAVAEEGTVVK